MERYDPDMVPNGSDDAGRYDYKSQRVICRHNCEPINVHKGPYFFYNIISVAC